MRFILNSLIKLAVKWCEKNNRIFNITGANADDIYMIRHIVFKSKFLCIYIHRFLRSDKDDPHDHPWNFVTYVAEGGYDEVFYDRNKPRTDAFGYISFWTRRINKRLPGSFAYRKATDIHQVVVPRSFSVSEKHKAPLTACIMFKRQRHWGFWPLDERGATYIDWRRYLNMLPDDARTEGSE